jgi:hypothetical protein
MPDKQRYLVFLKGASKMGKDLFEVGHTYTRQAIHEAVDGDPQSYRPR